MSNGEPLHSAGRRSVIRKQAQLACLVDYGLPPAPCSQLAGHVTDVGLHRALRYPVLFANLPVQQVGIRQVGQKAALGLCQLVRLRRVLAPPLELEERKPLAYNLPGKADGLLTGFDL